MGVSGERKGEAMIDHLPLILTIFTAVSSLTAAIASVVGSLRNKKIEELQIQLDKEKSKKLSAKNELYRVYLNVSELLQIEDELAAELDVNKRTTRKGHSTDEYIQPKRVQKRIRELEQEL